MKIHSKKIVGIITSILLVGSLMMGCATEAAEDVVSNNEAVVHTVVEFEMETGDKMVLELYPEFAPETVENFVGLVESGFYDGLTFHRIIKGFMIQGGDPKGDGTGDSEKTIKGEFAKNGFDQNTLAHKKGVISMARSRSMDSASSQFFIMDGEGDFLDGSYAAFGVLIEGENVLGKIVETPVKENPVSKELSVPKTPVVIKTIKIVK